MEFLGRVTDRLVALVLPRGKAAAHCEGWDEYRFCYCSAMGNRSYYELIRHYGGIFCGDVARFGCNIEYVGCPY